jgi:hypothetical protein
MPTETLIRLYADSKKPGICSAATCRAPLDWYRTLKDKGMPMNRGAVARDQVQGEGGRIIGLFSSSDSHWATCPASTRFGKGR